MITEQYIQNMNWQDFEHFVAKILRWNGYKVKVTPPTNDEGKDIIAQKNNISYYIECKHWQKNSQIGREYLEKLIGAAARDGIRNVIFVTTSAYHANAWNYAHDINLRGLFNIQLLNTKDLIRLYKNHANTIIPTKDTSPSNPCNKTNKNKASDNRNKAIPTRTESANEKKKENTEITLVKEISLNANITLKEVTEKKTHWKLTYPIIQFINNPIVQEKINGDLVKPINELRELFDKGVFYEYGGNYTLHYIDDNILSITICLWRYQRGACGDHSCSWNVVYDLKTGEHIPFSNYLTATLKDLQDYYPTHTYSSNGTHITKTFDTTITYFPQIPQNYFIDSDGKSVCIVFPSYKLACGAAGNTHIKFSPGNIAYLNKKNASKKITYEDLGIGNIYPNDTKEKIIKALGQPTKISTLDCDKVKNKKMICTGVIEFLKYDYSSKNVINPYTKEIIPNRYIHFLLKENSLFTINIVGIDTICTNRGISVGMSREKLLSVYGAPTKISNSYYIYSLDDNFETRCLIFEIINEKIRSIRLQYPPVHNSSHPTEPTSSDTKIKNQHNDNEWKHLPIFPNP